LVFAPWANHENFPIPYWFLPYFWDNKKELSENVITIDDQVELVEIILTQAHNIFSTPSLANDPIKGNQYKKR
jgi:hypothetical protein